MAVLTAGELRISLAARAHHVQYSARRGDREAIELLSRTAQQLYGPAPATAARLWAAAIALLPDDSAAQRTRLQRDLASSLIIAGDPSAARGVLLEALGPKTRASGCSHAWRRHTPPRATMRRAVAGWRSPYRHRARHHATVPASW